jgi:hypothetical protein
MARPKVRETNEISKIIELDKETIKLIAKDAIDRELAGFKPNAERILKEAADKIKKSKK